jgi:hypothetical protein
MWYKEKTTKPQSLIAIYIMIKDYFLPDISLTSLKYSLKTKEIYQETAMPMTLTPVLTFKGQKVKTSQSGKTHVGFKVFLSNKGTEIVTTLGSSGRAVQVDDGDMFSNGVPSEVQLAQTLTDQQVIES